MKQLTDLKRGPYGWETTLEEMACLTSSIATLASEVETLKKALSSMIDKPVAEPVVKAKPGRKPRNGRKVKRADQTVKEPKPRRKRGVKRPVEAPMKLAAKAANKK